MTPMTFAAQAGSLSLQPQGSALASQWAAVACSKVKVDFGQLKKGMGMRAYVLMGVMALGSGAWVTAAAQVSNSPLYEPSPAAAAPPSWPAWQGMQDGRAAWAQPYTQAPRYPTDSRNLTLDNRAPTLWPAAPELRGAAPRWGMQPFDNGSGAGGRRPDGLRSPGGP
jgi:hypothetical protein